MYRSSSKKTRKRKADGNVEIIDSGRPSSSHVVVPHSDYSERASGRHHHIPVLSDSTLHAAPPAAEPLTESSSPDDWTKAAGGGQTFIEADVELAEMADCELEALGLTDYLRGHISGDRGDNAERQRTHSNHPLHFWTPFIDAYVEEFLRLEGRGDNSPVSCSAAGCISDVSNGFRCRDCQAGCLLCAPCLLAVHKHLPFHRIEKWNGFFFEKTTLRHIGLQIHLEHHDDICPNAIPAFNDDFVIIAPNGIHSVALRYCGCIHTPSRTAQLLRARLFPSTVSDPKTAATFSVLELFQMLSFMSKISGFEFIGGLARLTENIGVSPAPDRYHVFMRIVREWRHVRLLKRMGRGHSETGAQGTLPGECAVLCPACPHPKINLPPDWKSKPESQQWLYSLFVGIDANFRLKRVNVSSDERDPGLNHGYAYLVENKAFNAYLHAYGEQVADDKSTCNNHDAIKSASSRGGKGTAASGLGTAECSRHDMKRPVAVGDLQKGERYVNMDYFVLSSLQNNELRRLVLSYDISCQWSRNLLQRCAIYPPNAISTRSDLELVHLVPKFHLPAHITKCQEDFSFNLTRGVGRTDGESPERGWAAANAVANSTKEMGPGSRRDTLDDHFGDYNWRKIINLGILNRKAKEAHAMREEHVDAFIEFDAALPSGDTVAWTTLCQTWEADHTKPNPFHISKNTVTDSEVRLRLAQQDEAALHAGNTFQVHDDITPSLLIHQGLQIQEMQHSLTLEVNALGLHATDLQKAKVLERTNSLKRKIDAWISIQQLYVPAVARLRHQDDLLASTPVAVQDIKLFLPSALPRSCTCPLFLFQHEWDFRYAHAEESLNELRGNLLLQSHMLKSRDRYVRGQRQLTRSAKLLSDIEQKVRRSAAKYRRIRAALELLSPILLKPLTWKDILRSLQDTDVMGLSSMDDSGSEGRKRLSWIWKVHGTGADADEATQSALRIEWCKARARAHRWQEECLLLAEEMRRVVAFFEWQQDWWKMQAESKRIPLDYNPQPVLEGRRAYAMRQARFRADMVANFRTQWQDWQSKLTSFKERDAYVMVECH